MMLKVEDFRGSADEWDAFVRSQPGWTHFHLLGWRGVMERAMGHDAPYLAARDGDGRLAGILPLVRVRSFLFGDYLVSMPFLNYGGPLGGDEAVRALADAAVERAREGGVDLLELRSRTPLPVSLPSSQEKVSVLLDLPPGDPDILWKGLKGKVRSQVRRPRKEGVTVRFGEEEVEPFFEVFARHMRDLGTPTHSPRLFRAIAESFGEDAWFGCAYLRGQPVACGCALRWGGELEMTWASALMEHSRIAPNMLLYWSFMERAVGEGVSTFNFGRCTPGGGTHRFKRQWGARDEQLWWYRDARREEVSPPAADQGAYSLGSDLWRRIPVPLATALGPRLRRLIPA